jgi:hypothetical protein
MPSLSAFRQLLHVCHCTIDIPPVLYCRTLSSRFSLLSRSIAGIYPSRILVGGLIQNRLSMGYGCSELVRAVARHGGTRRQT